MTTSLAKAVKIAFRGCFEEIKDDIVNRRLTFYNPPQEWTEKLLNKTALNLVLLRIKNEAKWN